MSYEPDDSVYLVRRGYEPDNSVLSELLVPAANHFVSEMGPCAGVNLTAVCKITDSLQRQMIELIHLSKKTAQTEFFVALKAEACSLTAHIYCNSQALLGTKTGSFCIGSPKGNVTADECEDLKIAYLLRWIRLSVTDTNDICNSHGIWH
eukprot:COSAG03_NODE_1150_length_4703_cov_101.178106_4_plen_150_part_00